MTELRFNFSGHPVAAFEIAPLVGANLPSDGQELAEYIRELLLSLPERERLLAGEPGEVILPGLAQAAALLLAEWHGQFGNWPSIRWATRGPDGFTWPEEAKADLNAVRESARTAR
jgi:hypothetical protein